MTFQSFGPINQHMKDHLVQSGHLRKVKFHPNIQFSIQTLYTKTEILVFPFYSLTEFTHFVRCAFNASKPSKQRMCNVT